MIKEISITDLKTGMFIQSIGVPWHAHPFLKGSFKIASEKQIKKFHEYGIGRVYIDTDKGLDVSAPLSEEHNEDVTQQTIKTCEHRETASKLNRQSTYSMVPYEEEIHQAKKLRTAAHQTIKDAMQAVRMGKAFNGERVTSVVKGMIESIFRNQDAFVSLAALKKRDEYTFIHSINVCTLSLALGKGIGLCSSEMIDMGVGSLLHDIGKMKIPKEILDKPGKLAESEYEIIKKHTLYGADLLSETSGITEGACRVPLEHHERCNGSGYPTGLSEENIGTYGLISAIADVYDAMTSDRVYSQAVPPYIAVKEIFEKKNQHFHSGYVELFVKCLGIYPAGSFVRLNTGEEGIVASNNQDKLLLPRVLVIFDQQHVPYSPPIMMDLSVDPYSSERAIDTCLNATKCGVDIERFLKMAL